MIRVPQRARPLAALAFLIPLLSGCSLIREGTAPFEPAPAEASSDAPAEVDGVVPRPEVKARTGNASSYVVFGRRYRVLETSRGFVETGIASWYGEPFHGRRTSSGEVYDMHALTAAHRSLPLPTYVQVTNLDNGRRLVLRVNDRGPFHDDRVLDVSYAAAKKLDMIGPGTARVEVRALEPAATDRAR